MTTMANDTWIKNIGSRNLDRERWIKNVGSRTGGRHADDGSGVARFRHGFRIGKCARASLPVATRNNHLSVPRRIARRYGSAHRERADEGLARTAVRDRQ